MHRNALVFEGQLRNVKQGFVFGGVWSPVGTVSEGLGGPKRSLVPVEPKVVPDEVLDTGNEGFESPGPS